MVEHFNYKNPIALSPRELEIIELKAKGLSNDKISDKLFISRRTVEHHVNTLLGKLNCHRNIGLAVYKAYKRGLIKPPTCEVQNAGN
jgi:DNA-binding NarL/FixJ family response regulator